MTNYILKTETGHLYITPTGFLIYAENYYSASMNWKSDGKYSPVPYFLLCRSIELGLKAFALAKGESIKVLGSHKVGHNLMVLLDKTKNHSLSDLVVITKEDETELAKANIYYNDKGFEYFKIKNLFDKSNLPDLEILKGFSEKLLKDIKSFILSSA